MSAVILSKNAERDFARLPKIEQRKIFKKIRLLRKQPFSGKLLGGKLGGLFSLRAWPYRIIYEYSHSGKIMILRILHRQKAYK